MAGNDKKWLYEYEINVNLPRELFTERKNTLTLQIQQNIILLFSTIVEIKLFKKVGELN